MYSHESTCTSCGNNFIVEVVPGQPMRQRGVCDDCRTIEWQRAEAAYRAKERARERQRYRWGLIVGAPILLIFIIVVYACSS